MKTYRKSFSRGDFIRLSSSAIAGASVSGLMGCTLKGSARNVSLGIQLWSVRQELAENFEGTIAALARMGFEGVEFAEYFDLSAAELRKILDEYGLSCCGSHVHFEELRGDAFQDTVAFNKTLGNENFIIRWIPEKMRDSRNIFLQTIEEFNKVAERLESHGMRLGYHNHDYIFEKFDGEYLWDILAQRTDERFILQLDTGHAARAGQNPVELIRRHPGRTASIHAKAYSSKHEAAVIGEDEIDWPGVIEASEDVGGIEWYILEYEIENVPPLEALKASINNFRRIRAS